MIGSEDPSHSNLDNAATFIGRGGTGILTIQNGGSLSIIDPFAAEGTGLSDGEEIIVGWESTGNGTLHLDNRSVTIDSIGAYLSGDVAYHYAVALHRLGKEADALTPLQVILQEGGPFSQRTDAEASMQSLTR
jgi:hypothetical protein